MSPRESVQEELNDTLVCLGLNDVYGIIRGKDTDKKGKSYRSLTFCKAKILDGSIHIYSPRFILVKWQTAIRRLPHKGQEVFRDVTSAKRWFQENFI